MAMAPNLLTADMKIETAGPEGEQEAAVRQLDALLTKMNIEIPKEVPGEVDVSKLKPDLKIEKLEVFSEAPAPGLNPTSGEFRGTLAELKEQGRLAEQSVAVQAASKQAAVGRYTRMAEVVTPETALATAPSVEMADQSAQAGVAARKRTDPTAAHSTIGVDGTFAAAHPSTHDAKGVDPTPQQPLHTVPELHTRIGTMAQNGGGKMTVSLSPPELGKVEVEVLTRGKRVEIRMASENVTAKTALESGLGDLRRSLEGQNLQLTHTHVRIGNETASGFSGFQQQFAGGSNGFHAQRDERGAGDPRSQMQGGFARRNAGGIAAVEAAVARPSLTGAGRVDVRI